MHNLHPTPIASLLTLEGLHQSQSPPSTLRQFYTLGLRAANLTHDCHNPFADSSALPPRHSGLSDAEKLIIREMNRLGMIVDVAHVSAETMRDALATSAAPVIFSHSSIFTLCSHPRNVPNDILDLIQYNEGVIVVSFYLVYTSCGRPEDAGLKKVADHIVCAAKRMGWGHVGIGADFDGMDRGVRGLKDVSKYPELVRELWRRGVGERELEGFMGGNVMRVLEGGREGRAKNEACGVIGGVLGLVQKGFLTSMIAGCVHRGSFHAFVIALHT